MQESAETTADERELAAPAPRFRLAELAIGILIGLAFAGPIWSTLPEAPPSESLAAAPDAGVASATTGAPEAASAAAPRPAALDVVVRRNDTLDSIFRRLQLSLQDLAEIRGLPGIRQSLDILKPGDVIRLATLNGELTALERRVSETETLSVTRGVNGDFAAQTLANALQTRIVPLHGRISSSLFRTVNDLGASDQVALQLAEVFRFDIDFAQELQPGDSFTIVLSRVWRDGSFLRDGDILAAEFVNAGHTYRALRYTLPDGHSEYFTPDGKSLRKAFLLAPVQFSRISSGFGLRWHPILNHMRAHRGIDYAAPSGTPIRAAGDGRVKFRGVEGGYGNVVMLAHSGGVETVYGHMSHFAPGLAIGKHVKQGELIGFVGMSGLATGPHLHYEYRVGGVHRNPASIKTLPALPIPATLRVDFDAKSRVLLASLDAATQHAELADNR